MLRADQIWVDFLSRYTCTAFQLDALDSAHPLRFEVTNESGIDGFFDDISYNKGASVIRMLVPALRRVLNGA